MESKARNATLKIGVIIVLLFHTLLIAGVIWIQVLTMRENARFKEASDSAIAKLNIPPEAELIKEDFKKKRFLDIDNGPSFSRTYKISGYNRQELALLFNSPNPLDQEVRYKENGLLVNIYLWPAPDWSKMNQVGVDTFYLELAKQQVDEFTIHTY